MNIPADDPRAIALVQAIRGGDVEALRQQLREAPEFATARIVDNRGVARTLLHIATDWPGHRPEGPQLVALLAGAGADVNAAVQHSSPGGCPETPLHWAASNDDVDMLDALLDAGANIEAPGAVFTGGTPMSDAVVFAQWRAARRLAERGAATTIWQAAALGLVDRVRECCASAPAPSAEQITNAFWHACRGGQQPAAEFLLGCGADPNWIGHEGKTPCDVASESGNASLVQWLQANGGGRRATTTD